jgi:hypothetical protein
LVKDLRAASAEIDLNDPNSFFNCLNFNQESGRLASVQMSIRVGTAHQVQCWAIKFKRAKFLIVKIEE